MMGFRNSMISWDPVVGLSDANETWSIEVIEGYNFVLNLFRLLAFMSKKHLLYLLVGNEISPLFMTDMICRLTSHCCCKISKVLVESQLVGGSCKYFCYTIKHGSS